MKSYFFKPTSKKLRLNAPAFGNWATTRDCPYQSKKRDLLPLNPFVTILSTKTNLTFLTRLVGSKKNWPTLHKNSNCSDVQYSLTNWYIAILLLGVATLGHPVLAGEIGAKVLNEITRTGEAQVIISLRDPVYLKVPSRIRVPAVAAVQENVLEKLPTGSFQLKYRYSHVPALAGTITPDALTILESHPKVISVQFDEKQTVHLAKSVPLIKANNVHAPPYTYTGEGVTVAVIDTGIDTDHPDLADDIVAQRCFLPAGKCPSSSGETYSNNAEDDHGHGTHVAGIVTSKGVQVPLGVAPNAKIVAVKVCDSGGGCPISDSIAALDWIHANLDTQPVQIINMSLGIGKYDNSGDCESSKPSYNNAVNQLVAKGVTIFASSGNNGYSDGIGRPGCFSNTIAVGATYDPRDDWNFTCLCCGSSPETDQVGCFSNSNSLVDVLAPGAMIVSSKKDGGTEEKFGTSQATPMAAGVAALMLEANPALTPAKIRTVLKDTGKPILDTRNNLTFPRIDALAAVNAILPGTLQFSTPTYTVSENGSSITVAVTRTGGNYGAIAVDYATSDGSATAGSDYNISNGTLNWNDGETANKIFTVSITDDSDFEGDENFTVILSNPTGGTSIGTQNSATVTIVENDQPPPVVNQQKPAVTTVTKKELPQSSSRGAQPLPRTMGIFTEIAGSGGGIVSSKPGGIYCKTSNCERVSYKYDPTGIKCDPDYCAERFDTATFVEMIVMAEPDSVFIGWGGHSDCVDNRLFLIGNRLCVAYFSVIHELTVTTQGNGKVLSQSYGNQFTGIDCGEGANKCVAWFSHYTTTFLRAIPAVGSRFYEFSGDCSGANNLLKMVIKADTSCTATFVVKIK